MTLVLAWLARHWKPLLGVLLLALVVWRIHAHGDAAGAARIQARWDAQIAVLARQRVEAADAARKAEERHRAELRAVSERFLAEQRKADEEHDRTVARLRDGSLRLRDRLTCPAGVPAASADPGVAFGAGARGFGISDAEILLRFGRDADRVARQLNALIQACTVR